MDTIDYVVMGAMIVLVVFFTWVAFLEERDHKRDKESPK